MDYREEEVRPILAQHNRPSLQLVNEVLWRVVDSDESWRQVLDSKAQTTMAFAGAISTVAVPLVAHLVLPGTPFITAALALVILLELAAITLGFLCLHGRRWPHLPDSTIVPKLKKPMDDDGLLALVYSAETAFRWHSGVRAKLRTKSRYLQRSQLALVLGAIVLGLTLATTLPGIDHSALTMSSSSVVDGSLTYGQSSRMSFGNFGSDSGGDCGGSCGS
jgi:hypothetical protein